MKRTHFRLDRANQVNHKAGRARLFVLAFFLASMVNASLVLAQGNVNVSPSMCFTPFLRTALDLEVRWHEHFILNQLSQGAPVWVICPIPFDPDTLDNNIAVEVWGAFEDGAAGRVDCEFNVVDQYNQNYGSFLNVPANSRIYKAPLNFSFVAGYTNLWTAVLSTTKAQIIDGTGVQLVDSYWSMAVNCLLPPGYGISLTKMNEF